MALRYPPNSPGVWPHTGAVLAGGLSTRMGQPKHLIRLPDGQLMIDAMIDGLAGVCPRIVLVGSPGLAPVRGHLAVTDLRPNCGPLGGIEALLASGLDEHYLVCPCDMPRITTDLLRRLTKPSPAFATVFRLENEQDVRPLPARISARALPIVRQLLDSDTRAVWRLMQSIETEIVEIDAAHAHQLMNVNAPDDLANLARSNINMP